MKVYMTRMNTGDLHGERGIEEKGTYMKNKGDKHVQKGMEGKGER